MEKLEIIVRAVVVNDGKILLCKNLEKGHYFLPGGHIENRETPEIAIKREMFEEVGRIPVKIKQIAEVKNSYNGEDKIINEIFYICLAVLDDHENIKSKESHIDFEWVLLTDLPDINFKPQKVIGDIVGSVTINKDFWITK